MENGLIDIIGKKKDMIKIVIVKNILIIKQKYENNKKKCI